jgi:drug/metabolite transporter (DMT)-like permease
MNKPALATEHVRDFHPLRRTRRTAQPGHRIAPTSRFGTVAVLVAAVGFGSSPLFATRAFDAGVSPISASFIRVLVMVIVLSPWAGQARRWPRESAMVAAGGAISMIGFAGFFVALDRAPIAAATVVYYCYPIVVLGLSVVVWRRRLQTWEVIACGGVIAGVVLAVGPIGISSALIIALAPAFLAPVGWAIFLLILSGPAAAMPTLPKVFVGALGGVVAVFPVVMWQTGGRLMPLESTAISSMALLTVCTLAIPTVLVTWGSALAGERATAMIGSFEFVVAVSLGWLLLGERLTSVQTVGVLLVIASAGWSARARSTQAPRTADEVHDNGDAPSADTARWWRAAPSGGPAHDY